MDQNIIFVGLVIVGLVTIGIVLKVLLAMKKRRIEREAAAEELKRAIEAATKKTTMPRELKEELIRRMEETEKEIREKQKQEKRKEFLQLLESSEDLITRFLEITVDKISITDAYGDESLAALNEEIKTCIIKIAQRDGVKPELTQEFQTNPDRAHYWVGFGPKYAELWSTLEARFRAYLKENESRLKAVINLNKLSDEDFEARVIEILKDNDYQCVVWTPETETQSSYLVVKKEDKTTLVLAKRFEGEIGGEVIQNLAVAMSLHGAGEGWIMTTSPLSDAASALAQQHNVKLTNMMTLMKRSLK